MFEVVKHKEMKVIEYIKDYDYEIKTVHNCYINGQLANGIKTWAFDEMEEDGLYTCFNCNGSRYLIRE